MGKQSSLYEPPDMGLGFTRKEQVWNSGIGIGRGIFAGGGFPSYNYNVIDYITIATLGNATDFGDLTVARHRSSGIHHSIRGVFGGGQAVNTIDYVTIATTGNALDFGDLTDKRMSCGGCSNGIRGVFCGGYNNGGIYIIDYITISTTGNATDFGDLAMLGGVSAGTSSLSRGIISQYSGIQYITIATLGNSANFGNMSVNRTYCGACSDCHGGLI